MALWQKFVFQASVAEPECRTMTCLIMLDLCRRVANEKLEQLKQVEKEIREAEAEANKLEKEKEVKVGCVGYFPARLGML